MDYQCPDLCRVIENKRGLFDLLCVLRDTSKAFDSNSEINITSRQSSLHGMKYMISISKTIVELQ